MNWLQCIMFTLTTLIVLYTCTVGVLLGMLLRLKRTTGRIG
jgi:hypothetical protein